MERNGYNSVEQDICFEHVGKYFLDEEWGLVNLFQGLVRLVEELLNLQCEIDELEHPGQVRHIPQVRFTGLAVDQRIWKTLVNVCFLLYVQVVGADKLLDELVWVKTIILYGDRSVLFLS